MKGFFWPVDKKERVNAPSDKQVKEATGRPKKGLKTIKQLASRLFDCSNCGLDKRCKSPRMEPTGEGRLGILIIAEAPGRDEDLQGTQLVGEAGQTLRAALSKRDIDLDRDCRKMNAVNCRPFTIENGRESNRAPEYFEVECCRSRVWAEIEAFKPKLILLLGNHAVESFLGHRWQKDLGGINKWRGWTIPDRDVNAWVCPTFHPSYINRARKSEPVVEVVWGQDLDRALACLDKPLPAWRDERECIEVLKDEDEIVERIAEMHAICDGLFYFDFECNSKKPYLPGRKILSCAISIDEDKTISFPTTYRVAEALAAALHDPDLPKAAHNMKFEDAWAWKHLNRVRNWQWDSMIAANILDNRKGTSGLKFQVYVNFGIVDYASHLTAYMDADDGEDDKDANALNRLEQAPLDDVLLYGGMDALLGRRLALIQMEKIGADDQLSSAYDLFHDGALTMADMEQNGMAIDLPYVQRQYKHITERRVPAMQQVLDGNEIIAKWKERHGKKFNMGSDRQLADVLVNVLGLDLPKTAKGNASVNAAALEEVEDDAPFVKEIANIERLKKVASTNLKGLMREAADGWLHPFFNLGGDADGNHVVTSFRSSSSSPNFQNIPKRNPELERIVRRAFIPRPGMQRLSVDFKGVEVCVGACVHKDPMMIQYITDKRTDMHRDMAKQLYILGDDEWTKECRQSAKNHYVFPEFYGDWWMSTARELWRAVKKENLRTKAGISLYEHLADKGIAQFRCAHCEAVEARRKKHRKDESCCFENHVRLVEDDFWNRRFAGYTAWKTRHMQKYERDGYFYLLTGFRVGGVLRKNQVLNLPVQGPAFHCLLYTLNRIWHRDYGIAKKEGWRSAAVGQIHDSGEQDVWPDERDHIIETYKRVISVELPKAFPWICVPMSAEFSVTPIGKSWYESKEIK